MNDLELVIPSLENARDSQKIDARECSILVGDSPCTTSYKKPGGSNKPNAQKKSLTYMTYLANYLQASRGLYPC